MHEDVECMLLGAVQGNCWDVGLGGNGGMQKKGGGVKLSVRRLSKQREQWGQGSEQPRCGSINQSVSLTSVVSHGCCTTAEPKGKERLVFLID